MDKELIKQAFFAGYKAGMEKDAGPVDTGLRLLGKIPGLGRRLGALAGRLPALANRAVRSAPGKWNRYVELLGGGNKNIVGQYSNKMQSLRSAINAAETAPGGINWKLRDQLVRERAALSRAARKGPGTNLMQWQSGVDITKPLQNELAAVRKARLNTGLGTAGGLAMLAGAGGSSEPDYEGYGFGYP